MALNETDSRHTSHEFRDIEALASVLDAAIMIYDRNDTLIAASTQFLRYFDVDTDLLQPGARLRDLFNATFDTGARVLGSLNGKTRNISREDWIAERTAIHWRERYESVERLPDGRWIQLRKRRMADGILISTIQDITNEKAREEEVKETLRQAGLVQVILDSLASAVIVKDSELRYLMVNNVFCRVFGLPRKQILGKCAADLVGPELAARFEKIESGVLETGKPYDALENIYGADGTIMTCVTRMRRSGSPGAYFVTVSFDNIRPLTETGPVEPDAVEAPTAAVETLIATEPPHPELKGRILVVDEDRQRSADRVTELKRAGYDAVATANADEAIAFLDLAKSMNLTVCEVEISDRVASALSASGKVGVHQGLSRAIEKHVAPATATAPAPAPVVRPSGTPVLSVVASALPPQEDSLALSEPVNQPPAASEPTKADPKPSRDRVRVLVAEDNDVNQIVFEQILESIGVDFRIVNNGQEAVAAWRASPPDLILMDVSMPVMNGLQATQAIRNAEAGEADRIGHVPVIAVTAHAMGGDRDRCLAAGMDDYLSKPVNPEKLEALIEKWVEAGERFREVG